MRHYPDVTTLARDRIAMWRRAYEVSKQAGDTRGMLMALDEGLHWKTRHDHYEIAIAMGTGEDK